MTPFQFETIATGNCLYVAGIPVPFFIVRAGVAAGNHWVLCPDEDFHVLPTGGLTLSIEGGNVTWSTAAGEPAMVITPLQSCEELSQGDVMQEIANARRDYEKPDSAAWVAEQIAGAASAGPEALKWTKDMSRN